MVLVAGVVVRSWEILVNWVTSLITTHESDVSARPSLIMRPRAFLAIVLLYVFSSPSPSVEKAAE